MTLAVPRTLTRQDIDVLPQALAKQGAEILRRHQPRATDVHICTYAKSGTTLTQAILAEMRASFLDPQTDEGAHYDNINDVAPWLELALSRYSSSDAQLAAYDSMPDPRLFKMHARADVTPIEKGGKYVGVMRDGLEVVVSYYHHQLGYTDLAMEERGLQIIYDFDRYFDEWLARRTWFKHVSSWWAARDRDNVELYRYQDVVAEKPHFIRRLARFLEWDLSDQAIEAACARTSFQAMKQRPDAYTPNGIVKPEKFIRRGTPGKSEDLITPEKEFAFNAAFCQLDERLQQFLRSTEAFPSY